MKSLLKLTPDRAGRNYVPVIDPVIAQLHERLSNSVYADSADIRISLLAEMIWRIYLNTTKAIHRRTPCEPTEQSNRNLETSE